MIRSTELTVYIYRDKRPREKNRRYFDLKKLINTVPE